MRGSHALHAPPQHAYTALIIQCCMLLRVYACYGECAHVTESVRMLRRRVECTHAAEMSAVYIYACCRDACSVQMPRRCSYTQLHMYSKNISYTNKILLLVIVWFNLPTLIYCCCQDILVPEIPAPVLALAQCWDCYDICRDWDSCQLPRPHVRSSEAAEPSVGGDRDVL